MSRIDSLYVSITTPDYAPSMAETIAKVIKALAGPARPYLIGVEPVYGVWNGERENTVKLTFQDAWSGDLWNTAELFAQHFKQEAVLWVTDTEPYLENFSEVAQIELTGLQAAYTSAYTETLEGVQYEYALTQNVATGLWATLVDRDGNKNKLS